jgi:hypothetical protein
MATAAPAKAPVHLWIVGLISLLWTGFGAFDYVMTQMNNDWYLSQMQLSDADRAYLTSQAAWAVAAWAVGVWGALLGSLLLLMRSRYAFWAYGVSLVGLLLSTLYQYVIAPGPADLRTTGLNMFMVVIWAIALGLFVYAWRMKGAGVLR